MTHDVHAGLPAGVNLPHLATRIFNTPMLVSRDKLAVILSVLAPRMNFEVPPVKGALVGGSDNSGRQYEVLAGGIAVIPIVGTLVHRVMGLDALSGLRSYQAIQADFMQAMEDPAVTQIVLDSHSLGGEVHGCFDTSDMIYEARGSKPITGIINEQSYSAAYAIASACDRVIVPRTGGAGSIGVIAAHFDQSEYDKKIGLKVTTVFAGDRKNDFNPHEPMGSEALQALQDHVDETYEIFVDTVARNRGMTTKAVRDTQAGIFIGKTAVKYGLADEVAPANKAITSLITNKHATRGTTAMTTKAGNQDNPDTTAATKAKPEQQAAAATGGGDDNSKVVGITAEIEAARKSGAESAEAAAAARATEINDLCALSGMPHLSGNLIASGCTVAEARTKLFEAKADSSNQTAVDSSQSPLPAGQASPLVADATKRAEAGRR